jgi:hypothetical protein
MPSVRREGDNAEIVWDWGSHVERMIREAQRRGEFDNLPGAGKPLDLEGNVFAGDMESAFRLAKNANAAPLWIELDKEIQRESAALDALLERTARFVEDEAARLRAATSKEAAASAKRPPARRAAWWPFTRTPGSPSDATRRTGTPSSGPASSLQWLEAERQRARALFLRQAAALDEKIELYNAERPRHLTWLEKHRLLPAVAGRRFDARIPPLHAAPDGQPGAG